MPITNRAEPSRHSHIPVPWSPCGWQLQDWGSPAMLVSGHGGSGCPTHTAGPSPSLVPALPQDCSMPSHPLPASPHTPPSSDPGLSGFHLHWVCSGFHLFPNHLFFLLSPAGSWGTRIRRGGQETPSVLQELESQSDQFRNCFPGVGGSEGGGFPAAEMATGTTAGLGAETPGRGL